MTTTSTPAPVDFVEIPQGDYMNGVSRAAGEAWRTRVPGAVEVGLIIGCGDVCEILVVHGPLMADVEIRSSFVVTVA